MEAIEKLEELLDTAIPKIEGIVKTLKSLEGEEELASKKSLEGLLEKIDAADTPEKKDAVLKEVRDFLAKLLAYYPYPYKKAKAETKEEEEIEKESQSTEDDSSTDELQKELEDLRKENESLKVQLEEIEAEKKRSEILSKRVSELNEIEERDWLNTLSDTLIKMTDEEFEKFKAYLGKKESNATIPEGGRETSSSLRKLRLAIKEVKS